MKIKKFTDLFYKKGTSSVDGLNNNDNLNSISNLSNLSEKYNDFPLNLFFYQNLIN